MFSLFFLCSIISVTFALPAMHSEHYKTDYLNKPRLIETREEIVNISGYAIVLSGFEGCTRKEDDNKCPDPRPDGWRKQLIQAGLEDMIKMMPAVALSAPDMDTGYFEEYEMDWNSAAAIEFLGSDIRSGSYRPSMQRNFNTLAGLNIPYMFGHNIHVRCDDPAKECGALTDAYVIHGNVGDQNMNDQMVFCDHYYTHDSLDATIDRVAAGDDPEDITQYRNRATVWAHELLHVSWLGKVAGEQKLFMNDVLFGRPGKERVAYSAMDCKWLGGSDRTPEYSMMNNPQNYMWVALANYVVKKKDFYPAEPLWTELYDPPDEEQEKKPNPTFGGVIGGAPSCSKDPF